MEFFGLTFLGQSNYIREIIREDYEEPKKLPGLQNILEARLAREPTKTFSEVYNMLDPLLKVGDGFSYGSYERLEKQRKKCLLKPVGPTDIYRVAPTSGQEIGFWISDSSLKEAQWMKNDKRFGSRRSEMTKTKDEILKANPLLDW